MSNLIVNQKLISLGGEFWVTDENENQKYQVIGSFLKFPKQFVIYDLNGQEVGKVTHKIISLLPQFFLEINGQQVATISKKLSLLKPKYDIDAGNITVEGNIWDMSFEIERDGQLIGRIDKKWWSVRDTYKIEVLDDRNEQLILGLVLAIDYVKREEAATTA